MLDIEAPEIEAMQKQVAETMVGDKCQQVIGHCLEMQSPNVHLSPLWNKLTHLMLFIVKDS